MKRVISLYLPRWPTDRLKRKKREAGLLLNKPLALVGRDARKRVVLAVDRTAEKLGVAPGMAAAQASALVNGLHLEEYDASADQFGLEKLALWALQIYSPLIACDSDGLLIDATGASHLFNGEKGMLIDIIRRLEAWEITARAAIAPTYGAAYALARYAAFPSVTVTDQELKASIRNIPITCLRLPANIVSELKDLGFDSIGELENQPRAPLAHRFGPELIRRLDQAYGRIHEPIEPITTPEQIMVKRVYAEPIAAPETIQRYMGILTNDLCKALEAKGIGAKCLDMFFHRVDSSTVTIRIGLSKPARDAKRFIKLFCDKLENVDPGFGIEAMTLAAPWVEMLSYQQAELDGKRQKADISSLIDTLGNRIGHQNLYKLLPVESDVPERSLKRVSPLATITHNCWPRQWHRPARLFVEPERIQTLAMLPDHPPISFTWRGERHRVRHADGPERIFGEWWKRDEEFETVRDYFQLEDESGERFWVYRTGDGVMASSGLQEWFLHGVFS